MYNKVNPEFVVIANVARKHVRSKISTHTFTKHELEVNTKEKSMIFLKNQNQKIPKKKSKKIIKKEKIMKNQKILLDKDIV